MASKTYNLNTWAAKRIIGDNSSASPESALLHNGGGRGNTAAGDTWIFYDDASGSGTPWGIKHDQVNDKISLFGNGTNTSWVSLGTGNLYTDGKIGIGYDPGTNGNTYKLYVDGTGYFNDDITSNKSIWFGENSTNGKAILGFNSTYSNYGIWYFNESVDVMTLSASGNADGKTDADFGINVHGAGTLTNRNNRIPHTGNTTGTVGGTEQPVYVNAGTISSTSYALKATVNNGTTGRLVYYSDDRAISSTTNIHALNNYLISNSRNGASVDIRANGLIIWGQTYGNTANQMISNTAGVFRFGDGGPQIVFNTSNSWNAQAGALVFTDHDTAGTGTSFHFVSTESSDDNGGNCTVTAPRFRARRGITIGQNSDNTSYNLYVNGTSYFNGHLTSSGGFYSSGSPGFNNTVSTGTWAYLRLHNGKNLWDLATKSDHSSGALEMRIAGGDTGYYFNTGDMPSGAANLSAAAAQHSIKFYRNGFAIPYGMDNANDGGILRVRGAAESATILELGTWDDSGTGETIQFNYYPTTSQITPTYSISVPKHSGTLVTTDGHGASGSWGISVTGSSASCTGNAATATKLATAREIYVALGTTRDANSKVTFDGSADKAIHVSGTLPVARGGTGKTSVADIQAGKDGDGNTISSTYAKLSGATFSGNVFVITASGDHYVEVKSTATGVRLELDNSGSTNHGLWSSGYWNGSAYTASSSWMIYRNASGTNIVNGNCTGSSGSCTGNAATATKATQDGSGNTITSYYCTLSTAQTFTGNKTFNSICYFANGTTYYVNKNGDCRLRYLGCGNLDASTSYAIRIGGNAYISGHHYFGNGTTYYINSSGTGNLNALTVNATTASSSTATGALIVKGGIGAAGKIYGSQIYNAVWNDYAECREVETEEPGRCVTESSNGKMILTQKRLMPGCKLTSDTFGTCMGETEKARTPIAVAGRVLAYPYRDRNKYKLGAAVCSAPNGTIDVMTRAEIMMYPERIVGTISEIPDYEIWYGGTKEKPIEIKVNNRIWIYVR